MTLFTQLQLCHLQHHIAIIKLTMRYLSFELEMIFFLFLLDDNSFTSVKFKIYAYVNFLSDIILVQILHRIISANNVAANCVLHREDI